MLYSNIDEAYMNHPIENKEINNEMDKWKDYNDFFSIQNAQDHIHDTQYMNDILKNDAYEFDNTFISAQGELHSTPISDIKKTMNHDKPQNLNHDHDQQKNKENKENKIKNHYKYIKLFINDIYLNNLDSSKSIDVSMSL